MGVRKVGLKICIEKARMKAKNCHYVSIIKKPRQGNEYCAVFLVDLAGHSGAYNVSQIFKQNRTFSSLPGRPKHETIR